jgi:hypothetical protein
MELVWLIIGLGIGIFIGMNIKHEQNLDNESKNDTIK